MDIKSDSLAPALHYLATLIFIGFYGVQVCPFIDGLTPMQLAMPLVIIIGFQYLLRHFAVTKIIHSTDFKQQIKRTFQLEWGLFLVSGILLTASNSIFYDFPVGSGLKMILGFATLGFFAAIDLALKRERQLEEFFRTSKIALIPDEHYFPLSVKFSFFAVLSSLFLISIFFLMINKDLDWLSHVGNEITRECAACHSSRICICWDNSA